MIEADLFVRQALERGFGLWSGVPCSYLKPFINHVIDDPAVRYIPAVNEGDAVAIASGSHLAGIRGVAMFQNSGLGNAVNPLTSLNNTYRIPVLLIVTLRGEPGAPPDAVQHGLMGPITTAMLDVLQIPWEYFPDEESKVSEALDRAITSMNGTSLPYALVMRKGSVAKKGLKSSMEIRAPKVGRRGGAFFETEANASRSDMLKAILDAAGDDVPILGTTGYTGRELYAINDRSGNFYMAGSMGCVSSIGLGISTVRSGRVIAVDGDGAILMRMGALATNGYQRPENLVHIVLDNGMHESTGGQATVSASVDLCAVAAACGYRNVFETRSPEELRDLLSQHDLSGITFIRARTIPGSPENLPRPTQRPEELSKRFAAFLQNR